MKKVYKILIQVDNNNILESNRVYENFEEAISVRNQLSNLLKLTCGVIEDYERSDKNEKIRRIKKWISRT